MFSIKKGVATNEQVQKRFLESLDVESSAKIMNDSVQAILRLFQRKLPLLPKTANPIKIELYDEEKQFLLDVHQHLASTVTERYTRLGLNPKKGTRLSASLVEKGFLNSISLPIPGSHVRLFELTPASREILSLPTETDRLGSLEHRYWVEKIAEELNAASIKVEKEAPLGEGKTVDLLVFHGKKRIGIEVETGKSDWKGNVRKCLDAGLDKVIVAGTRPAACRTMKNRLPKTSNNLIEVLGSMDGVNRLRKKLSKLYGTQ